MSSQPEFSVDLSDLTNIFEYAGSRLLAIHIKLEKTKLKLSPKARNTVSRYLNWEAEAFTLPWIGLCSGISMSLPLSQNLRYHISMVAMKQLYMVAKFKDIYDAFMTLKHAWWKGSFADMPDEDLLGSYLNCVELKAMIAEHYEQLPEGIGLVMPAMLIIPKSTPVTQQLSNITGKVEHEGHHIVKMLEDKVIEAQIVAASLLQMESALGEDIMAAIPATEKLAKFLKRETSP
ncbi:hypothetical protein DFJ58DRAFT_735751 [Suillus subalutaceus]|uniref:uncharacterized protein n=1 Tax=Suillus subalutaceus TaxID=48586 RepID=UPI001B878EA5|nr:uncharacterized protein DFJ58DRAFT_735751 [Suillus subalutaceus]KAG1834662.1 hypothetical protein DFJ58DRAFT_735751 [Suillus subalutaceus]